MIIVIGIYNHFLKTGEPVFMTSHYYTRKIEGYPSTDIEAELIKFQEESFVTLTNDMSNRLGISVTDFKTKFKLEIIQLTIVAL